jgi:hypothetical protein
MNKIFLNYAAGMVLALSSIPAFADMPTISPTPTNTQPTFAFGGMVDAYYSYNFPNASDNTVGQGNNSSVYFYNGKDDSLALGLAELTANATQGQGSIHLVLADGISASPSE